ncbi:MAG: PorT family protein [Cyclobacteriaceae bacterium]|nr:PorT family protein [Cyclobacteriaceae bacterium]
MKKVLILVGLLAFCTMAQAQSFGGKLGINMASISGSTDATSKIVFHGGLWALFKPTDKFGIMPEVVYSSQGCGIKGSSAKVNLSYINVPLMFNYYFNENFFMQAGPQVGFLMSANLEDTGGNTDIKQYMTSTDISIGIGAGGQWDKFLLNARYNIGMNDVISDAAYKAAVGLSGTLTNSVIQISLGYKF